MTGTRPLSGGDLTSVVTVNKQQEGLDLLLFRFIYYLKVERRLSLHTQRSYTRHLQVLAGQMQTLGITEWVLVDEALVRRLAAKGKLAGLGQLSLRQRFSALRSFFDYLVHCEIVTHNPLKDFTIPCTAKRLPKNLATDEVSQLLAINTSDLLSARDSALMELIYGAGLRLAEVISLDANALNLESGEIRVIGKGGKMRQLPIGRRAVASLQHWLKLRAALPSQEGALFVSYQGRRLSSRGVQKRLAQWGIKQGLTSRIHPHRLRHAFATHMLESSGDIRAVQELLGHATLSSTQIYTHLNFQHLATVYDSAHPRAKRRKP